MASQAPSSKALSSSCLTSTCRRTASRASSRFSACTGWCSCSLSRSKPSMRPCSSSECRSKLWWERVLYCKYWAGGWGEGGGGRGGSQAPHPLNGVGGIPDLPPSVWGGGWRGGLGGGCQTSHPLYGGGGGGIPDLPRSLKSYIPYGNPMECIITLKLPKEESTPARLGAPISVPP